MAVEGDRIAAVGPGLAGAARHTIDATGHVVTPGFIDIHSHSDLFYLETPAAESKLRQGCTTEVVGMCSFSPAPVPRGRPALLQSWAGGIGARLDLKWETFGQYLDALRAARPSINVVHFVGHGALRLAAVGAENRALGPDDTRAMERLLHEALEAGAFGFSTGLVYPPSAYATTEELVGLARSMATRGGLYFSHVQGESATVEAAIAEAIRIGEDGGVGVQIAHVKVGGRENWPKIDAVLKLIDDARARGVDVSGDVYPYHAGSTKMDNLLPAWVHDGGTARCWSASPIAPRAGASWKSAWWTASAGGRCPWARWGSTRSRSRRAREVEGLTLAALARRAGTTPAEAMMNLLVEERATVSMVAFSQSHNVARVLAHPAIMVGSDSLGLTAGPGPRQQAPPAHVRHLPSRARRVCARAQALLAGDGREQDDRDVRASAGPPGSRDRQAGRGRRPRGLRPPTVKDEATFADPHRHPTSIWVIVNGALVVERNSFTAAATGRVLTRSGG